MLRSGQKRLERVSCILFTIQIILEKPHQNVDRVPFEMIQSLYRHKHRKKLRRPYDHRQSTRACYFIPGWSKTRMPRRTNLDIKLAKNIVKTIETGCSASMEQLLRKDGTLRTTKAWTRYLNEIFFFKTAHRWKNRLICQKSGCLRMADSGRKWQKNVEDLKRDKSFLKSYHGLSNVIWLPSELHKAFGALHCTMRLIISTDKL